MVMKKVTAGLLSLAMLGAGAICELPVNVSTDMNAYASELSGSTTNYTFGTKKTINGFGEKKYKLNLSSAGRLDFDFTKVSTYKFTIYDSKGKKIASVFKGYENYMNLKAGTYTMKVNNATDDIFKFSVKFTSAKESFKDTGKNDKKSGADTVKFDKLYKGQLAENDSDDYYKVNITNESGMLLSLTSKAEHNPYVKVLDQKGNTVYESNYDSFSNRNLKARIKVSKGTYYIRVYYMFGLTDYTGNYDMKLTKYDSKQTIGNVSSSYVVHPELGIRLDPTVKEKAKISYKSSDTSICTVSDYGYVQAKKSGKVVITITAEGTTGYKKATKRVTVYCTPKRVSGLSGYTREKGTATLSWTRNTDASGYVIKYARNSKFKSAAKKTVKGNATTSYTLKGLKSGEKYWITIYAYKIINGKMYYSTDPYISITGKIH